MDNENILQYSLPRSGSTLIFNILRSVFPDSNIIKVHRFSDKRLKSIPTVSTYRHPLDILASSIQRYGLTLTDKVIEQQIREYENLGINNLREIRNQENVLMLRYEDFVYNYDNIYAAIECFFEIDIPLKQRQLLSIEYHIDNVKKKITHMKTFAEYDNVTHWHGKHISKYKGEPGYANDFFTVEQLVYLKEVYRDYIDEFGY